MCENKTMPLVSIIMGAYNCENTIIRAVNSIQNQTYNNWEFIICDDCSSDGTLEILCKLAEMDNRIRILHNCKNSRLAASLNHCLSAAKGKYIARMDADDESMPDRLKNEVDFLETNPQYDCVGTGRVIFDENGNETIKYGTGEAKKETLLKQPPFVHPTIMMKKSVYDNLGGYIVSSATMRAEDLDLWFRFFENGYRGYNIKTPLYRYQLTLNDYKKRTVKAGIQTARVYLRGYKRIGIPFYKYYWAFKPIVSAIIPDKIMKSYHAKK